MRLSLLLRKLQPPLRQHQPGSHRIKPNLGRTNIRQTLSQMYTRRLSNRIRQRTPTRLNTSNTSCGYESPLGCVKVLTTSISQPHVCFYIVEKTFVPVFVEMLFVKVEKIGQACVACVGDYDVEAAHGGEGFLDERVYGVAVADVCFYGVEAGGGCRGYGAGDGIEFFEDFFGAGAVVCVVDHL